MGGVSQGLAVGVHKELPQPNGASRGDTYNRGNRRVPDCQSPEPLQPIRTSQIILPVGKPGEWLPRLAHKLQRSDKVKDRRIPTETFHRSAGARSPITRDMTCCTEPLPAVPFQCQRHDKPTKLANQHANRGEGRRDWPR